MVNLAFGMLFGNEDLRNWTHFWEFVVNVHPTINRPQLTILTDQDKGSINAVRGCIPEAFNFHCSFHRKENIIKNCGCASGKNPKSALFLFNLLLRNCINLDQLQRMKTEHLQELYEKDRQYLTKLDDNRQFAAARCAMGDDISMYGRSASSGVESMNRANIIVREKSSRHSECGNASSQAGG
jgi:hypothetical protein